MKIAVVDVGNTSTAVGIWSNGRVSHVTHHDGGFKPASAALRELARSQKLAGVSYLSVVPKSDPSWRGFAENEND